MPVTLLAGYLGAGKTTVLNRLLAAPGGRRIAVLVNDVGDVAIDTALVAAAHDDVVELTNGCVCCSLVDGFAVALEALRSRAVPPDHVVIELSGVAEPGRVVPWTRTAGFRLDGVLTLVDADQILARVEDPRLSDLVIAQVEAADLVLVSKADLGGADPVRRWVRTVTEAPMLDAPHGAVDVDIALGVTNNEDRHIGTAADAVSRSHRVTSVDVSGRTVEDVVAWLHEMDGVVRAKGLVTGPDGTVLVERIGNRVSVTAAAGVPATGTMVLIEPGVTPGGGRARPRPAP